MRLRAEQGDRGPNLVAEIREEREGLIRGANAGLVEAEPLGDRTPETRLSLAGDGSDIYVATAPSKNAREASAC